MYRGGNSSSMTKRQEVLRKTLTQAAWLTGRSD